MSCEEFGRRIARYSIELGVVGRFRRNVRYLFEIGVVSILLGEWRGIRRSW